MKTSFSSREAQARSEARVERHEMEVFRKQATADGFSSKTVRELFKEGKSVEQVKTILYA